MGEYSYQLYVRYGEKECSSSFTVDCLGDTKDDVLEHLKSLPGVLSIAVSRLEDDGVWVPE